MLVSDFDFHLPEARIALRPVEPRDRARLLVVKCGEDLQDCHVGDLARLLRAGDVLLVNNSRVIPTQLFGVRGAAQISATLIKRVGDGLWWGFVKNARRLKQDDTIDFGHGLRAQVRDKQEDGQILFAFSGFEGAFEMALEAYGQMPLPPYIASKRAADAKDRTDYQTAYAKTDGSVAAPTAGLHFTDALMAHLKAQGVTIAEVTLHVGAGTFLPMKVDDTRDHVMHAEWGSVSADVATQINKARAAGGRLVCVGTTSLRLIESAADENAVVQPFVGETDIFITPGYRFKVADLLMTNFHLPKSTLFMLVSAFAGVEQMKAAYVHAIDSEYRFYSYGDSSLLYRHD
jgi:S-adenosylmethionine:tRNA ribosyltransferase-isomerase